MAKLCDYTPLELVPVKSGNVAAIGYDPKWGTMQVRYNNGMLYEYYLVSPLTHLTIMEGKSVGGALHRLVTYKGSPIKFRLLDDGKLAPAK